MALFIDTAIVSLATFTDFPGFQRLLNTILNTTFNGCWAHNPKVAGSNPAPATNFS